MRKTNQVSEHNEFFEDEILQNEQSINGNLDQEYQEFKEGVLSGKINEWDCKNPQWLALFEQIKKEHSKALVKEIALAACNDNYETNHSDSLKFGEFRDKSPDDDE